MDKGIIAKVYDRPEVKLEFESIFDELAKFFTRWTVNKLDYEVKFQSQFIAIPQRKVNDTAEEIAKVNSSLNFFRGMYLENGFDVQVYVYDTFEPWHHTPEYDAVPIQTTGFTNIGDTVVIGYIPPQINSEAFIIRTLTNVISLELLHVLLYRKMYRKGIRPDPAIFDTLVHENYEKRIYDAWDNGRYVTTGGDYSSI